MGGCSHLSRRLKVIAAHLVQKQKMFSYGGGSLNDFRSSKSSIE